MSLFVSNTVPLMFPGCGPGAAIDVVDLFLGESMEAICWAGAGVATTTQPIKQRVTLMILVTAEELDNGLCTRCIQISELFESGKRHRMRWTCRLSCSREPIAELMSSFKRNPHSLRRESV